MRIDNTQRMVEPITVSIAVTLIEALLSMCRPKRVLKRKRKKDTVDASAPVHSL